MPEKNINDYGSKKDFKADLLNKIEFQIIKVRENLNNYKDDKEQVFAFNSKLNHLYFMKEWLNKNL